MTTTHQTQKKHGKTTQKNNKINKTNEITSKTTLQHPHKKNTNQQQNKHTIKQNKAE